MITKIYAVRDAAVEAFMPPFFARSDAEAIRMFRDAASDAKRFAPHINDYSLWVLGAFSDGDGALTSLEVPKCIMNGVDAARVIDA